MDEQGKCFDCGIAAYLIDPLAGKYDFDMVAASVLSERPQGRAELLGKMSIEDAAAENAENLIKLISFEALIAFALLSLMKALRLVLRFNMLHE